jgi:pyridinium-3,5-bisthiocarboxylic acid mononucleotide nickel chelatase
MKIAYFDCFSGISGDMALGSLVGAGCEFAQLEAHLHQLPLTGWTIAATKVNRNGLAATRVTVECSESHHHRSLSHILKLIEQASLPPRIAARASAIFRRLADAEARVHDLPIDKVHFHEVGAVDAIIDIVGASVGLELLGIEEIVCSALNVGGGRVKTQHGILPVPAPATADLLRGAPTYSTGIEHELVTPTGAAIVTTLASRFGAQPAMTVGAIGQGAGNADFAGQANVLRLFVGEAAERAAGKPASEAVVVLEANFDDMSPQIYGYFVDCALAAGALDVFSTPVQMKKNRPGQLVTVLSDSTTETQLTELIFRETTTLGVRRSLAARQTLQRERVTVETAFGPIRVKVARLNGQTLNVAPEYDDCRTAAMEKGVPLKRVLAEASFEYHKRLGNGNEDS